MNRMACNDAAVFQEIMYSVCINFFTMIQIYLFFFVMFTTESGLYV